MSCSYHILDCQTDVIVFGGNKRRLSKFDRNVITSPVIIRFGKINAPTAVFMDLLLKVWPKIILMTTPCWWVEFNVEKVLFLLFSIGINL